MSKKLLIGKSKFALVLNFVQFAFSMFQRGLPSKLNLFFVFMMMGTWSLPHKSSWMLQSKSTKISGDNNVKSICVCVSPL